MENICDTVTHGYTLIFGVFLPAQFIVIFLSRKNYTAITGFLLFTLLVGVFLSIVTCHKSLLEIILVSTTVTLAGLIAGYVFSWIKRRSEKL